jgi:hypothetical protein
VDVEMGFADLVFAVVVGQRHKLGGLPHSLSLANSGADGLTFQVFHGYGEGSIQEVAPELRLELAGHLAELARRGDQDFVHGLAADSDRLDQPPSEPIHAFEDLSDETGWRTFLVGEEAYLPPEFVICKHWLDPSIAREIPLQLPQHPSLLGAGDMICEVVQFPPDALGHLAVDSNEGVHWCALPYEVWDCSARMSSSTCFTAW